MNKWYTMKYETREWKNKEEPLYLSRLARSRILTTYEAALPDLISDKNVILPHELDTAISDLIVNITRFDTIQKQKGYGFPNLLLRSESAASSQIENLTSSIRNIALAELSTKTPKNAQLIAANVAAMYTALNIKGPLSITSILEIHKILIGQEKNYAGVLRNEPVWIGGTSYSPHGALFVPPHESHIKHYLDDLISYSKRIDINPIVKAAVIHAQFETIHPFIDGNGRTGRTLLHKMLREDGILQTVTLPISAGLLNNTDSYMQAISTFQNGNPIPIIKEITTAIELAVNIGEKASNEVSLIIANWENVVEEKKNSSIWKLLYLIIEQPVINSKYLEDKLQISLRAANKLIQRAIGYGILKRIGTEKRGIFYQSDEIISIMDMISQIKDIKRFF